MKPDLASEAMISEVSCIFSALGDASRLKILRVLLDSGTPLNQGGVAEASGLSQANTSKHLACLVRVGLVVRAPEGNTVFFRPVLPLVSDLCHLVCGHVSDRAQASYDALRKA